MDNAARAGFSGFNLLDEPWIPVTFVDGAAGEVSLRELFASAPHIQAIAGELPQMSFATTRVALAILYRAYSIAEPARRELIGLWRELWEQGSFEDGAVEEYLEAFHDRFDLFDEQHPFFQVPGLEYMGKDPDPVGEFMADVPKRDKYLFAMRAPQCVDDLSYTEAARYLVLAQAFDTAGIKAPVEGNSRVNKGKVYAPKGAVGTGWCGAIGGVMLEGPTLFETLLLNFVLHLNGLGSLMGIEGDVPPWELPPADPDIEEREPRGPVDALTWQSRRIRLVRNENRERVVGVVLCYGTIPTAAEKQKSEQMTAWRESIQQQKRLGTPYVPRMPITHDPSRAIWRGLPALLSHQGAQDGESGRDLRPGVICWLDVLTREGVLSDNQRVSIHAVGMSYGTQSSVFDDSVDDTVSLHLLLVRDDAEARQRVIEMVGQADEAVKEFVRFVWRVETAQGDKRRYDSFSDGQANAMKNGAREWAYEVLDELFRNRIAMLTPDDSLSPYCAAWLSEIRTKLLACARDYVTASATSMFSEHSEPTPGQALVWFENNLNRILQLEGAERAQQDEGLASETNGREDA